MGDPKITPQESSVSKKSFYITNILKDTEVKHNLVDIPSHAVVKKIEESVEKKDNLGFPLQSWYPCFDRSPSWISSYNTDHHDSRPPLPNDQQTVQQNYKRTVEDSPTDNDGDFKNKRKKKTRTVFSRSQVYQLETTFDIKRYLSSSERATLASSLTLTETQIKIWFQNRRNKWKRQMTTEIDGSTCPSVNQSTQLRIPVLLKGHNYLTSRYDMAATSLNPNIHPPFDCMTSLGYGPFIVPRSLTL